MQHIYCMIYVEGIFVPCRQRMWTSPQQCTQSLHIFTQSHLPFSAFLITKSTSFVILIFIASFVAGKKCLIKLVHCRELQRVGCSKWRYHGSNLLFVGLKHITEETVKRECLKCVQVPLEQWFPNFVASGPTWDSPRLTWLFKTRFRKKYLKVTLIVNSLLLPDFLYRKNKIKYSDILKEHQLQTALAEIFAGQLADIWFF